MLLTAAGNHAQPAPNRELPGSICDPDLKPYAGITFPELVQDLRKTTFPSTSIESMTAIMTASTGVSLVIAV